MGFRVVLSPSLALAAACASGPPAASVPGFDLVLKPVREGTPEVTAVLVRWELRSTGDSLAVAAPIVYAGVTGIADRIEELEARDRRGALELSATDDAAAPGGFPYFRHWRARRSVSYPVVLSYRARVQPDGERNGPPFSLRTSGGGVSGAGPGFLVLPEDTAAFAITVRWDLSDLASGSMAVASFGAGDTTFRAPLERLQQAWYLAGPAGRYPESGDAGGFSAAWLGPAPFDAAREMQWVGGLYTWLGREFAYPDPPPRYRVFMRFLTRPPCGGGTALEGSFMLSRCVGPGDTSTTSPRETFAHELIHQWVGQIEGPQGVTSWFSEGLTTHYARLLPMRGGFMTVDWYGSQIAVSAEGYYVSPGRNFSADSIAALGFGDENIRHVPYHRGALYFADLDARIRKASGSKRTLDDVMRAIFERRQKGERFDQDAWLQAIVAELDPSARGKFEAVILRGETIVPAPDAFGPCFTRRPKQYQVAGRGVDGFEWIRVAGVPDERCRDW